MTATRFTEATADVGIAGDTIAPIALIGDVVAGKYFEFEAPYDLEVREVSTRAAQVTNPADGDVTVDVLDDGVSILSAPLSYAAANATYKQADLAAVIAKGSIVRVVFSRSGTGHALQDPVVAITARRHFI